MLDRLVRMPTARLLLIALLAIVANLAMGFASLHTSITSIFSLDTESVWRWPPWDSRPAIPAFVSGALMLLAGWCWLEWSRRAVGAWGRLASTAFGLLLIYLAFDEMFALHETLTLWWAFMWQLVYAPVIGVVGVAIAIYLARVGVTSGRWKPAVLVVTAGTLWLIAQILEFAQFRWNPPVPGSTVEMADSYFAYVFVEETLESIGSVLLLLAVIVLARARRNAATTAVLRQAVHSER